MSKCLNAMYQKDYHNRATMMMRIADSFRMSYCQIAVLSLLGTLTNELLKVVYGKFDDWLPLTDDEKFSRLIIFLDERLAE